VKGKRKVDSGGVQHGREASEEPYSDDKDGDDAKCGDEEVNVEDWFTLPIADWCTSPTRNDSELDNEVRSHAQLHTHINTCIFLYVHIHTCAYVNRN
jgi:hypothetical protein